MVESKSPQAGGPAVRLVPLFVGVAALVTAYYSFKRPAPDSSSPRLPRIGEMPSEARGSTGGKIATNKGSIGGEKR